MLCIKKNMFSCYVGERYREDPESIIVSGPGDISLNSQFVFFDNDSLTTFLKEFGAGVNNATFHLVGCGTEKIYETLLEMKETGRVREIVISVDTVYKAVGFPRLVLGTEAWDESSGLGALYNQPLPGDITFIDVQYACELQNKVDEVIDEIFSFHPQSDLEKILLLDLWFQRNIQYIEKKETKAGGGVYICEEMERESVKEDVLINHFGVCGDISFTAALILNHPRMGVHCRQIEGFNEGVPHSWNVITLEGKEYITDFTQNITRNEFRLPYALMTSGYSYSKTLLGREDVSGLYSFSNLHDTAMLSNQAYSREILNNCLKLLQERGAVLTWDARLAKYQRKKE